MTNLFCIATNEDFRNGFPGFHCLTVLLNKFNETVIFLYDKSINGMRKECRLKLMNAALSRVMKSFLTSELHLRFDPEVVFALRI